MNRFTSLLVAIYLDLAALLHVLGFHRHARRLVDRSQDLTVSGFDRR